MLFRFERCLFAEQHGSIDLCVPKIVRQRRRRSTDVTGNDGTSTTFSGGISGSGGLTKIGGTFTLSGSTNYTGATAVNAGTLAGGCTSVVASCREAGSAHPVIADPTPFRPPEGNPPIIGETKSRAELGYLDIR
jgi:autotransporter-associated beta strand protein